MPRFKLTIEYAGTRYSGWQIQKNARTVQGELDRAIREISSRKPASVRDERNSPQTSARPRRSFSEGGEFELYGSGRTDAGVHALAQVAHLELYTQLNPEQLRRRIDFTRVTMRYCEVIFIRSPGGARPSESRSSGGSASQSIRRRCVRLRSRSRA
jgi:tRNA pseudouridine(38-40) synthase